MIELPKQNEGEDLNQYINRMIIEFKNKIPVMAIIELAKQNYN